MRICLCQLQAAVKIMAKDYVRAKRHIQKFMLMRTQLQGVGLQLQVRALSEATPQFLPAFHI